MKKELFIMLFYAVPFWARSQNCLQWLNLVESSLQTRQYESVLLLLDDAERECGDTRREYLQKIKIDCLIELDSPSSIIKREVEILLNLNPQFDATNNNEVSSDLANYIRSFNVYPNLKVAVHASVPFWWATRINADPIFTPQLKSSYTYDALASLAFGASLEYFPRRHISVQFGYELARYAYERNLQFDMLQSARYTERIRYHRVQSFFTFYPARIRGFNVSAGYNASFLIDARADIFASDGTFRNGIDQHTRRTKVVYAAVLGAGMDLFKFLNGRAMLHMQAEFHYGTTPVNDYARRLDNADLNQDYYYTDDSFYRNAINVELSAKYTLGHYIKPY